MSEELDLKDWAIPPEKLPEYESIPPKPKVCHSKPERDAWAKLRRGYFKTLCATRHRETIVVGIELLFLAYQSGGARHMDGSLAYLRLSNQKMTELGIDRKQKARALQELKALGLVSIERQPRKSPLVALRKNPYA